MTLSVSSPIKNLLVVISLKGSGGDQSTVASASDWKIFTTACVSSLSLPTSPHGSPFHSFLISAQISSLLILSTSRHQDVLAYVDHVCVSLQEYKLCERAGTALLTLLSSAPWVVPDVTINKYLLNEWISPKSTEYYVMCARHKEVVDKVKMLGYQPSKASAYWRGKRTTRL
jgi:hypothetical protein